jgi:ATPase subunit of ABC transporter with duplicated ATPase domains
MSILEVSQLKFNYGGGELFVNASFRLFRDDHMVLVGSNGTGKTTLLNLLSGKYQPDAGSVSWMPKVKVGYLDQYAKIDKHLTIFSYLSTVYEEMFAKEAQMEAMYESIAQVEASEHDAILRRASAIGDYLIENDFYAYKSRISGILSGLGLQDVKLDTPISKLSGGMRAKIILAKLLLEEADCLLLDEPTNFLDVVHIEWLTKFLNEYQKSFIVVSHHEEFIRSIANVVLLLENKELTRFKGNYDFYLKEKALRSVQHEKNYESQQKQIKELETFIDKNIARASTTKRAQSREKKLEKIVLIEKPTKTKKLKISFPYAGRTGDIALVVKDLVIGYDQPLLKPIQMKILKNQKVVIVGKNGIGKSTFLKTLIGEIPSLGGSFRFAEGTKINYFPQENDLDDSLTAFQIINNYHPLMVQKDIFPVLHSCGVSHDLAIKPIGKLSGGEKTKVRLAVMTLVKSNLLIFDEPTNHLDVHTKKYLIDAIKAFSGTVILVTHEEEFSMHLGNQVIHMHE